MLKKSRPYRKHATEELQHGKREEKEYLQAQFLLVNGNFFLKTCCKLERILPPTDSTLTLYLQNSFLCRFSEHRICIDRLFFVYRLIVSTLIRNFLDDPSLINYNSLIYIILYYKIAELYSEQLEEKIHLHFCYNISLK